MCKLDMNAVAKTKSALTSNDACWLAGLATDKLSSSGSWPMFARMANKTFSLTNSIKAQKNCGGNFNRQEHSICGYNAHKW